MFNNINLAIKNIHFFFHEYLYFLNTFLVDQLKTIFLNILINYNLFIKH
jgi:hypothetical protein